MASRLGENSCPSQSKNQRLYPLVSFRSLDPPSGQSIALAIPAPRRDHCGITRRLTSSVGSCPHGPYHLNSSLRGIRESECATAFDCGA
jgi:hypothetical protein